MQMRRDLAVLDRQHQLDEAGHTCRGLEMAEVGLDRPDDQRPGRLPAITEDGIQRLELDRIANSRPRAVRFDVRDVQRIDARRAQRLPEDGFLRGAVRHGQPAARAILVDGRAADHGEDRVAVGHGVRQALQEHDAAAFAPDESVGCLVERLAPAVRRHHPPLVERDEGVRQEHDLDATGQRQVALAQAQALAGEVDSREARGAGRVDRHGGPLQAKGVGDAAGGRIVHGAGHAVHVEPRRVCQPQMVCEVERRDADEDAGQAAPEPIGRLPGALERFPDDLQHQALLGIDRERLAGRDTEEMGIEAIDPLDEAAVLGGHVGARLRVERHILTGLPPIAWHLADRVRPGAQHRPVGVGIVGAAGEPARQPDDGNRLDSSLLGRLEPSLHLFDGAEGVLQDGSPVDARCAPHSHEPVRPRGNRSLAPEFGRSPGARPRAPRDLGVVSHWRNSTP